MTSASGVRPVCVRTVPHQKRMLRMNFYTERYSYARLAG